MILERESQGKFFCRKGAKEDPSGNHKSFFAAFFSCARYREINWYSHLVPS
jgi:hypothetical protein